MLHSVLNAVCNSTGEETLATTMRVHLYIKPTVDVYCNTLFVEVYISCSKYVPHVLLCLYNDDIQIVQVGMHASCHT